MEEGIQRKYQRMIDLLYSPAFKIAAVHTEIEDLRRDLKLSGQSDEPIEAHTGPNRFNA